MSKSEKLKARFRNASSQFRWDELESLMHHLGFTKTEGAGSRVSFSNGHIVIKLHKPHPQKEVKAYAVRQLQETLINEGLL